MVKILTLSGYSKDLTPLDPPWTHFCANQISELSFWFRPKYITSKVNIVRTIIIHTRSSIFIKAQFHQHIWVCPLQNNILDCHPYLNQEVIIKEIKKGIHLSSFTYLKSEYIFCLNRSYIPSTKIGTFPRKVTSPSAYKSLALSIESAEFSLLSPWRVNLYVLIKENISVISFIPS